MVESYISEAVKLCLDNWTALKLAVDMGWGEESDKSALQSQVVDYILRYDVEKSDISNLLEDILEEKFSVVLEDQSAEEIAEILLRVFEQSSRGETTELERLRGLRGSDTDKSKKIKPQPGLVQAMEELNVSPPELVPVVDEDGFQMVVPKKQKKNK